MDDFTKNIVRQVIAGANIHSKLTNILENKVPNALSEKDAALLLDILDELLKDD